MLALIVGTLLALVALAYVLWPLISAAEDRGATATRGLAPSASSEVAVEDPVEAEIRRARTQLRVCPACGPRPEPAARYCSRCGRPLA
jgi:hypothetical protein